MKIRQFIHGKTICAALFMILLSACGCNGSDTHAGNVITGISGISGDKQLVVIYKCLDNNKLTSADYFDSALKHLPVINIHGDIHDSKDEGKSNVTVDYYNNEIKQSYYATLKVQGASSAAYPKKNYNIQIYKDDTYDKKNDIELVSEWGKQSKYTLKANYIDYSHARNLVSGKLYGKISKSRDLSDGLEKAPNGGAVDGYPVLIFKDGEYLGLYTLNIPKDTWMFGIKKKTHTKSAIVMADDWTPQAYLSVDVTNISEDETDEGIVCEERGAGTNNNEIMTSFNTFTGKLRDINSHSALLSELEPQTVKRGLDTMIFTWIICAPDNIAKNIVYVTYDGTIWLPSVYDVDGSFGLHWQGKHFNDPVKDVVPSDTLGTLLWQVLYKYDRDEVKARYEELRNDILSYDNIIAEFEAFLSKIPDVVRNTERHKWTDIPSQNTNNLDQIKAFTKKRLEFLDNMILH